MTYEVEFASDAIRDFTLIFDFLVDSYVGFGDDMETAISRAVVRVESIREDIMRLGRNPHRGTVHDDILTGLRHVTLGRAIVWFDLDEEIGRVSVLAIFFGGQDHQRRMLIRLLEK